MDHLPPETPARAAPRSEDDPSYGSDGALVERDPAQHDAVGQGGGNGRGGRRGLPLTTGLATPAVFSGLVLALWTVLIWGRPALPAFATLRLSNPGDSESFVFYLSWNVHALLNGENPFFTPNLYAPGGLDLGNAISIPSVSLLVSPVTLLFGGTAGYNAAFLISIFLCGLSVALLSNELSRSRVGGTIAGGLTVVSPYFAGHALSHMNLMWVFGLPFLAYLTVKTVRGTLRRRWLALGVVVIVAFTVGASTELLVTETVFGVLALCVALVFVTPDVRGRLVRAVPALGGGAVVGVALASPVILAALRSGIPVTVANDPTLYSSDLTNVIAPTQNTLIGDTFFQGLRAGWLGNQAENTAYLPISLLILVGAVVLTCRTRMVKAMCTFAAVAFVCSLGPLLNIAGMHTVPLPWDVATLVPGLDHALPARFSAFVFMALVLVVAEGWARQTVKRWVTAAAVAVTAVLLVPNLGAMLFPTDASLPPYVTEGGLAADTVDGENILVLPAGQWGPGMRWMEEEDFSYEMPIGNGGGAEAPPQLQEPTAAALFARNLDYDYGSTLLSYLDSVDVRTVIVDGGHPEWKRVMDQVSPKAAQQTGGVWVYELP